MAIEIPELPPLSWLGTPGEAEFEAGVLTMHAGPQTDWFNDPDSSSRKASAPVLAFPVTEDCELSARVSVGFASTFDAGVLFIHQSSDDYAKLCFERSPLGENLVVSVVTRGVSDDANGPVIGGDTVHLRVTRRGPVFAFHYSLDAARWEMVRIFALRDPRAPTTIGFSSQAPTGESCTAMFADITYTSEPTGDFRNGT